jgi:predicted S18 family serine protease
MATLYFIILFAAVSVAVYFLFLDKKPTPAPKPSVDEPDYFEILKALEHLVSLEDDDNLHEYIRKNQDIIGEALKNKEFQDRYFELIYGHE